MLPEISIAKRISIPSFLTLVSSIPQRICASPRSTSTAPTAGTITGRARRSGRTRSTPSTARCASPKSTSTGPIADTTSGRAAREEGDYIVEAGVINHKPTIGAEGATFFVIFYAGLSGVGEDGKPAGEFVDCEWMYRCAKENGAALHAG
jgi:hypothetical protein